MPMTPGLELVTTSMTVIRKCQQPLKVCMADPSEGRISTQIIWALLNLAAASETLSPPGICYPLRPVTTTIRKPYKKSVLRVVDTYCGRKKCLQTRISYETHFLIQTLITSTRTAECCYGYQQTTQQPLKCDPVCSPKCVNSYCSSPGTCVCFGGYKKNSTHECVPECKEGCINSKCSAPDVCTCTEGYKNISAWECKPFCSKTCQNSECTEPEVCRCLPGYRLNSADKYQCLPTCDRDCINGQCIAPNKCLCSQGYIPGESPNVCKPVCSNSCQNGNCTEPETCSCYKGYIKTNVSHICEPVCTINCRNSVCTGPEECSCLRGYSQTNEPGFCEPVCSLECIFGNCTAPETCTCYEGYRKTNLTNVCEPICSEECINGFCSEPETCSCSDNYTQAENSSHECLPVCSQQCVNGFCASPDLCECLEGYEQSESTGNCIPVCSRGCINGKCTAPEECTCNPGFLQTNNISCVAGCPQECLNGTCKEPGICTCLEGYRRDDEGRCSPDCPSGCSHGQCFAPGLCQCTKGFMHHPENSSICLSDINHSLTHRYSSSYISKHVAKGALLRKDLQSYTISTNGTVLLLGKSCASLLAASNKSCNLEGCLQDRCLGFSIDCFPKIISNGLHYICQWDNIQVKQNISDTEATSDDFSNLNETERGELVFTLLLPDYIGWAERGSCNLCFCETKTKTLYWDDSVRFEISPCELYQSNSDSLLGKKQVILLVGSSLIFSTLALVVWYLCKRKSLICRGAGSNVNAQENGRHQNPIYEYSPTAELIEDNDNIPEWQLN